MVAVNGCCAVVRGAGDADEVDGGRWTADGEEWLGVSTV